MARRMQITRVFAKMLKIPPPIFEHLRGKLGNFRCQTLKATKDTKNLYQEGAEVTERMLRLLLR